jgi:sRNA-binding protein
VPLPIGFLGEIPSASVTNEKARDWRGLEIPAALEARQEMPELSNKAQKAQAFRAEATALIGLLAERFPNCFTLHEAKRSPLKINIAADILAALAGAISRRKLGYALSYYTHSNGYLAHMRAGAAHIDLDGNTAGEVSPEHAGHAAERLTARTRNPAPRDLAKAKPPASKRITLADLREAAKRRDARP